MGLIGYMGKGALQVLGELLEQEDALAVERDLGSMLLAVDGVLRGRGTLEETHLLRGRQYRFPPSEE